MIWCAKSIQMTIGRLEYVISYHLTLYLRCAWRLSACVCYLDMTNVFKSSGFWEKLFTWKGTLLMWNHMVIHDCLQWHYTNGRVFADLQIPAQETEENMWKSTRTVKSKVQVHWFLWGLEDCVRSSKSSRLSWVYLRVFEPKCKSRVFYQFKWQKAWNFHWNGTGSEKLLKGQPPKRQSAPPFIRGSAMDEESKFGVEFHEGGCLVLMNMSISKWKLRFLFLPTAEATFICQKRWSNLFSTKLSLSASCSLYLIKLCKLLSSFHQQSCCGMLWLFCFFLRSVSGEKKSRLWCGTIFNHVTFWSKPSTQISTDFSANETHLWSGWKQ